MQRILVIDDEPVVRELFRLVLERAGYAVEVADGGRAGLAALAARPASLVIVDLVMPDIDGLHTIRKVRQQDPRTSVIPMTGVLGAVCPPDQLAEICGSRVLRKPLTPQRILGAVGTILGR